MKKAMVHSEIAVMIFVAASLIVVLALVVILGRGASNVVDDNECRVNVFAHAQLLKASGEALVSDIYCPTKYRTLPVKNEDGLNKAMADSLKSCWNAWGEGDLQLFNEQGLYCHVCSTTRFSNTGVNSKNFGRFLLDERIQSGAGKGLTYAEYLKYASIGELDAQDKTLTDLTQPFTLDTSKEYSTIFIYAKGKNFATKVFEFLGGGVALTGGAVTGGAGGLVVGGGLVAAGASVATGFVVVPIAAAGAGVVYAWVKANKPDYVAMTLLTEYTSENLKQIGCTIAPTRQDRQQEQLG